MDPGAGRRVPAPRARVQRLLSHDELRECLAHLANIEYHHPDLEIGYNYCRIVFTTHTIKGLSENDFICAAKVDLIPRV